MKIKISEIRLINSKYIYWMKGKKKLTIKYCNKSNEKEKWKNLDNYKISI
jgi:hypothetical protein